MKNVNLAELANIMSSKVEIVGLRPGEKLNETLISNREIPYTRIKDNLIFLFKDIQPKEYNLDKEHSSITAENMTKHELKQLMK